MSRRAPSRRVRNSRSASSVSSCSHQAMVVKSVYCFSSAPLRSSSYIATSPRSSLYSSRFSSRVPSPVSMQSAHSTQRPILPPKICISLLVGIQFSLYFGVVSLTSHVPRLRTVQRRAEQPTMTLCGVAVRQGRASSQPCISSAKPSSWLSSSVRSKCSVHNRSLGQASSSDMAVPDSYRSVHHCFSSSSQTRFLLNAGSRRV